MVSTHQLDWNYDVNGEGSRTEFPLGNRLIPPFEVQGASRIGTLPQNRYTIGKRGRQGVRRWERKKSAVPNLCTLVIVPQHLITDLPPSTKPQEPAEAKRYSNVSSPSPTALTETIMPAAIRRVDPPRHQRSQILTFPRGSLGRICSSLQSPDLRPKNIGVALAL